jgi:hypothetical protein
VHLADIARISFVFQEKFLKKSYIFLEIFYHRSRKVAYAPVALSVYMRGTANPCSRPGGAGEIFAFAGYAEQSVSKLTCSQGVLFCSVPYLRARGKMRHTCVTYASHR